MESEVPVVQTCPVPDGAPVFDAVQLRVEGRPSACFAVQDAGVSIFSFGGGTCRIDIETPDAPESARVRPDSFGITPEIDGRIVSFTLDRPRKLAVEIDGTLLFIFADALEEDVPDAGDADVVRYGPGYHDLGGEDIVLESGRTLYLEGGAYLDNGRSLVIRDAEHVRVCGRGVLAANTRVLASRHVDISGIVLAPKQRAWMNKIDASRHVRFHNYKVLAGDDSVCNYDGFDVMSGCSDILMEDIFLRATDDCLTVKHHPLSPGYWTSKAPICRVCMRDAVLWNLTGGTVFRIGPETIGPSIEDVTMTNIDVIRALIGFEILPVDGVRIRRIRLEDIRIEAVERNLVDFRMPEWYKVGSRWGRAEDILLKNWDIHPGVDGWRIEGRDDEHGFFGVRAENLRRGGAPVVPDADFGAGADFDASLSPDFAPEPPQIVCAEAYSAPDGATRVYVVFSHAMDEATCGDAACYVIPGAEVRAARLDPQLRQVVLDATPLDDGATLSVDGVCDAYGAPVVGETTLPLCDAWDASRSRPEVQGCFGWWFEQCNPEPHAVYNNRPDICAPPQYRLMNFHPEPDGDIWMAHDEDAFCRGTRMRAGRAMDVVRTWTAPADGMVRIRSSLSVPEGDAPGARARILLNAPATDRPEDDETLLEHEAGDRNGEHELSVEVRRGAVIRFRLSPGRGGATADWNTCVAYC